MSNSIASNLTLLIHSLHLCVYLIKQLFMAQSSLLLPLTEIRLIACFPQASAVFACLSDIGICTTCSKHVGLMELLAAWHSCVLIIYLGTEA